MLPVSLIGMNADLMKQYIHFVFDSCVSLGATKLYNAENPFPWMEMIPCKERPTFERVGEYPKAGDGFIQSRSGHNNASQWRKTLNRARPTTDAARSKERNQGTGIMGLQVVKRNGERKMSGLTQFKRSCQDSLKG